MEKEKSGCAIYCLYDEFVILIYLLTFIIFLSFVIFTLVIILVRIESLLFGLCYEIIHSVIDLATEWSCLIAVSSLTLGLKSL